MSWGPSSHVGMRAGSVIAGQHPESSTGFRGNVRRIRTQLPGQSRRKLPPSAAPWCSWPASFSVEYKGELHQDLYHPTRNTCGERLDRFLSVTIKTLLVRGFVFFFK